MTTRDFVFASITRCTHLKLKKTVIPILKITLMTVLMLPMMKIWTSAAVETVLIKEILLSAAIMMILRTITKIPTVIRILAIENWCTTWMSTKEIGTQWFWKLLFFIFTSQQGKATCNLLGSWPRVGIKKAKLVSSSSTSRKFQDLWVHPPLPPPPDDITFGKMAFGKMS